MKRRFFMVISFISFLFIPIFSFAADIVIEYGYKDSHYRAIGIATSARAFPEGKEGELWGDAKLIDLKPGKYVEVEETHYSPQGGVIYKARSKFSLFLGEKISEEPIKGEKILELFRSWPVRTGY